MRLPRFVAVALLAAAVCAQEVPEVSTLHYLGIDSGLVANTNPSPAARGIPQVVWSTVVTVPGSAWLRLHYAGILLAGARDRGSDGSFLRLTSAHDGAVQTQHLVHVGQWQETSAYFNGDSVLVELLAHPNTGDNRLMIRDVSAGPEDPMTPDTICGPTDDRVLSNDQRVGRNQPTGCTSWLIDDCNHCFLTAGHCAGSGLQVIQFNVPLSTSSGSIQHPPPSDQYAVDGSSLQTNGGQGTGNDWAYFGVFPNSTTGLTPHQANGGQAFDLLPTPPPVAGQDIRVTGNGSTSSPVSPTWYLVQKTHAGPYFQFTGTTVSYQTDTTGGNSGSPVIVDGTNQAIAIHTHGGCNSTGGSNIGTGSNHAGLQAALAAPLGVCYCPELEFSFPNGLPNAVAPDGSTVIRVQVGGPVSLAAGTVRFHVSTGGAFQTLVPAMVNASTFDATVPSTSCGTQVAYYFSAQGVNTTSYTSPEGAPASVYNAPSANGVTTLRNYDFNTTPPGWSVVNTSLTTGAWVRGTPIDPRGPAADFDGSGQCWVTGNANNEDVDGGPTELYTETVDLTGTFDPTVTYAVWFDSFNGVVDTMTISASNNGGSSWTVVGTVGVTDGWEQRSLNVRQVFANPAQFRMRFTAVDQPNDSVTEAALDAFRIDDIVCNTATWSAFGTGCANGGSAPALALVTPPALGSTFELTVDNLATPFPFMLVGLDSENAPLPSPPFANGCTLLARPDVAVLLTPVAGSASWSLAIPNDPMLAGAMVYQQAAEFGALWTLSQGGVGEIQ